jgi:TolB-like protein
MKMRTIRTLLLLLPVLVAAGAAWGSERPERIWILPFAERQPDPALEHLRDALPALLAVAVSASDDFHSVVEREDLDSVLSEQRLGLEHLTEPDTRDRVGRLLGATVIVTGSFSREGTQLHVTMRALDLESGIVVSTADDRGAATQPGALVSGLYRRLAVGLGRRLPELAPLTIDEAPLSNLHFMKGLGHYYSARYSQAVAEFLSAAEDAPLADVSRFWLANAYLAERQYSHACLELIRLTGLPLKGVPVRQVASRLAECERHLSREELSLIRDIAGRSDRSSR